MRALLGARSELRDQEAVRGSCPALVLTHQQRVGTLEDFNRAVWALLGPDTSRYRTNLAACARAGVTPVSLSVLLNRDFDTYEALLRRIPSMKPLLESNDSGALLECIQRNVRHSVTFAML